VPEEVRRRFVQVGRSHYFPDGARAFEDRGKRLVTPSENTEVIRSLIAIAQARGWADITVAGTARFKSVAWHQGQLAGLLVRGYKPDEFERAQLVRALAGEASAAKGVVRGEGHSRSDGEPLIIGKLLKHGTATYRFDRHEQPSYYVTLNTDEGERTLWGKDLKRAFAQSVTKPQIGDEIGIRPIGRDPVTVRAAERNAAGDVTGERVLATHRNRWLIESRGFFEARALAAQLLRDPQSDPKRAAQQHPELVSEYLKLRGAELIAKRYIVHPDDRREFVALVRDTLAAVLARGEPVSPVRVRTRVPQESAQGPLNSSEREQVHVRG
jgi:hypothetical protein